MTIRKYRLELRLTVDTFLDEMLVVAFDGDVRDMVDAIELMARKRMAAQILEDIDVEEYGSEMDVTPLVEKATFGYVGDVDL